MPYRTKDRPYIGVEVGPLSFLFETEQELLQDSEGESE